MILRIARKGCRLFRRTKQRRVYRFGLKGRAALHGGLFFWRTFNQGIDA